MFGANGAALCLCALTNFVSALRGGAAPEAGVAVGCCGRAPGPAPCLPGLLGSAAPVWCSPPELEGGW